MAPPPRKIKLRNKDFFEVGPIARRVVVDPRASSPRRAIVARVVARLGLIVRFHLEAASLRSPLLHPSL